MKTSKMSFTIQNILHVCVIIISSWWSVTCLDLSELRIANSSPGIIFNLIRRNEKSDLQTDGKNCVDIDNLLHEFHQSIERKLILFGLSVFIKKKTTKKLTHAYLI